MNGAFRPNEAQKKAITFPVDRPLKVIAGAGTGKTELLTRRFVHIVKRHKLRPQRVLALTFTKKAAAEMRRRIVGALSAEGLIDRAEAALLTWIGNFHSISLKLLRQNPLSVGLDPLFEVIEETEQRLVLDGVIQDFLDNRLAGNGDDFAELMITNAEDFTDGILSIVSRLKARFIEPADVNAYLSNSLRNQYRDLSDVLKETIDNPALHGSTRKAAEKRLAVLPTDKSYEELFFSAVHTIYKNYNERLESRNVLDFNDLVFYACKSAQADPHIKRKFDYILVDEFQDTDSGQYRLLEALSRDFQNVTVVGDKKQLIYEWREARLENIVNFPGETLALDENYRSFAQILDAANDFIRTTMPEEPALKPALEGGRGLSKEAAVRLFRASTREREASFVAREIRKLLSEGRGSGDIAVLVRGIHSAQFFEEAFEAEKVDFTTVGGCGFYDLKETKDLMALLRLVCDPFDDQSMVRVLRSDLIGLSDRSLHNICKRKRGSAACIYDVLTTSDLPYVSPSMGEKIRRFVELIHELAQEKWTMPLGEFFSALMKKSQYLRYLSAMEGPRGPRFSNVARFYKEVTLFAERNPGAGLEEFLRYLDAAQSCNASKSPGSPISDRVQIMTIHQAKGLEFPVVFLVGVVPSVFPSTSRSGNFGYEDSFGLYAKRHPDGDRLVRYEGKYSEIGIEKHLREKHNLEENRIMYVALTRAKDLLYVTSYGTEGKDAKDFFELLKRSSEKDAAAVIVLPDDEGTEPSGDMPGEEPREVPGPLAPPDSAVAIDDLVRTAAAATERLSSISAARSEAASAATIDLTFSRLSLFRRCRRKYAFRYIYKFPNLLDLESEVEDDEHISQEHGGALLGNLLHQTLMHYHRELKLRKEVDAPAMLLELGRGRNCPRSVVKIAQNMLEKYLAHPLSGKETLFEEKEFHWKISGDGVVVWIHGKVDRVHREGEVLKIVDYKSGLPDADTHRFQLALYRMALESVLHEKSMLTGDFYFSTGEEVDYVFSEDELVEIRAETIRDAREIAAGRFLPDGREKEHECALCEFKALCV